MNSVECLQIGKTLLARLRIKLLMTFECPSGIVPVSQVSSVLLFTPTQVNQGLQALIENTHGI